MRKGLVKAAATLLSAFLVSSAVLAGGISNMPSTAPFNEPSQEIASFNAFIQYLNGQPGVFTPGGGVPSLASLGSFATAAGGSPQTCNAQRCSWAVTGITVTTTGSTQTLVLNNSVILAASLCRAHFASAFTAGSAVIPATVTASAGSLSIVIVNAGTTSNAVTTGTLLTNCDQ